MSGLAALAMALLLLTQPLLFGQAFINLKDALYMALFALTVALEFHAADRFTVSDPTKERKIGLGTRSSILHSYSTSRRAK
jgi:4-amino-4-deoxy-L-arabinose transferase-like glycosyltransferase